MSPTLVTIRAGIWPAESASRSSLMRSVSPGRIGESAQVTLSCAAAWIASYSQGATTPMNSPTWMTRTCLRCATEAGSTESGVANPALR